MDAHSTRFMEHALALARKGIGLASPNPMVGCILVREGQIVGEGFHQYEWRDHAEVVALKSAGEKARGATMYVTLEPCHHTGRTGPCTEAIIAAGVQRVVAAMEDPNPVNSGRGFQRLRAASIEVEAGVCEEEARRLNEAFACWIRTGKPFVTLKSALTLDGQLALPGERNKFKSKSPGQGKPTWITSEESRAEVHRMRRAADALLTGIGTIKVDDPLLTDRSGLPRRKPLLRVILNRGLSLSPHSRVVKTADEDVLVFANEGLSSRRAKVLQHAGIEVVKADSRRGQINLETVLIELGRREVLSVLLEAGPTLNGAALAAGIVHKLFLFYAPKISGETRVPFALAPNLKLPPLQKVRSQAFGPDIAVEAYLQDVYR
ncbi:MAG TPA: bifunctional diaminohydroxyphosphoribosylaminopyrimidine deaminase/5-amino-6-(5-phosphoribosylamino)uracil reductase RibD [Candidatus Acidoferrum sp.]|nr:bifunctional diaminohydroxyphosphoribosylaminopyrimidine deaminase/5-amino-6-(5-phosphoribosylamino)uracil reductase RibD [Candidatus Acidoferrum sp.]